ncbi:MAG: RNA methyltransferase [Prevotellaceae bacterium]|jgi:TrmH family RNA methyltransferase|nr:RNA methyltransferase [Prevotellaceae bacterium]
MFSKSQKKHIASLSQKKYRDEAQQFVVEGEKSVAELLVSDIELVGIYHTKTYAVPPFASKFSVEISEVEMSQISNLKTPGQVLAVARIPRYEPDPQSLLNSLTIMLDGVQDPGNMGTIVRLCDWFGIRTIVCSPGTADVYGPKVVQASMGSAFRVKICYMQPIPLLELLQTANLDIYGTFLEGENIYRSPLYPKGLIIMGNEGHGISPDVAGFVSRKLYIPRDVSDGNKTESLNVASATAIVMSEFRRSRLKYL